MTPPKAARAKGKAGAEAKVEAPPPAPSRPRSGAAEPPRLRVLYRDQIHPALMGQFAYRNPFQVPRLRKVVLNMGLGEAVSNVKVVEAGVAELAAITGQRPVITRARKSEAAFKLRAGMPIGCKVTLRGDRMYEFLDRLLSVALPRIRDFRGIPTRSFDGRGNYALGLREQLIFPEIRYDKVEAERGMDVCIETTARNDEEARALLERFGFPFRR